MLFILSFCFSEINLQITRNKRVNNALCELTRPRGDFELIFPLKNNINKYKKFFLNEDNIENTMFWEQIMKPKK